MGLLEDWDATVARLGAGGQRPVGRALLQRYAEPHRHYHTTAHLAAVLAGVDRLADESDHPDTVRLAAWFHDAVYDPRRGDNEDRSAALAQDQLAGILPSATVARVAALVRLTAGHDPPAGDRDGAVLCDADLAVLASPPTAYRRYVDDVRREYSHVPQPDWRSGRAAVLEGLLGLPRLFGTTVGSGWEPAARHNVSRELAALADGGVAGADRPR